MSGKKMQLVEATSPVSMNIVEGKSGNGRTIVRGEFGRVDVPTANGRIYPEKVMKREIDRLMEEIKNGSVSVCGCCDHPENGKTSILDISHRITDLYIKDGIVYGEAEIFDKFPSGAILKGLIDYGVKVGVSSRGYGSTAPSRKAEGEEVQDDFVLKTYDFVSDPAMKTAIPTIYTEDVDDSTLADLFLEQFPEIAKNISVGVITEDSSTDASSIRKKIEKELSERFEKKLKDAIIGLKEDVSSQIREEYSSDPEIGGAKGVLAAISDMVAAYRQEPSDSAVKDAIKASELAVSEAVAERDKFSKLAKDAAYALRLERKISGHPMAESIRKIFEGREFGSLELLDSAISSVLKEMPSPDTTVSIAEAKIMEENASLKGEIALLESKVEDLTDKVERAVRLGERVEKQRITAIEEANSEIEKLSALLEDSRVELESEKKTAKMIKEEAGIEVRNAKAQVYKLEKVAPFTNGRKMLSLMESITDTKVVDGLVENLGVKGMQDPMLEGMRRKHQKGLVSDANVLFEEDGGNQSIVTRDDFGNSMDDYAALAGIPVGDN